MTTRSSVYTMLVYMLYFVPYAFYVNIVDLFEWKQTINFSCVALWSQTLLSRFVTPAQDNISAQVKFPI